MGKFDKLKSGAVTDEQGKMRLHGAFTGGFSAGYFNSVGTIEGFQPATFVSSRNSRAEKVARTAKDYMEESDESEDSDEELVDEMLQKTGLDAGTVDSIDGATDKRIASNMKIKPSADFVNMEYSLLGDKSKGNKVNAITTHVDTVRDVYEVNNLFKKNATAADILSNDVTSSNVPSRKTKVTSLYSSDGYSYEEGIDSVYNNDPDEERMQYTREEVGINVRDDDDDDDIDLVPLSDKKRRKKEKQLSQIHDTVEKWLDEGDKVKSKSSKTDKLKSKQPRSRDQDEEQNCNNNELDDKTRKTTSQFIVPKLRHVQPPPEASVTQHEMPQTNFNIRDDELRHQKQYTETSSKQLPEAPPPAVVQTLATHVNIFDLIKPSDKLKLQNIATKGNVPVVSDKLSQSISSDVQSAAAMQVKLQEIQAKARLNLLNVTMAEADKANDLPVQPAARPMLSTGFKTDSTFATLQEAFKNRFTSASTTSSVHQDTIVKEGMATASEYVAVKQLNNQQISENETTLNAASKTDQTISSLPVSATSSQQRKEKLKSIRTVALWAPSPLLCKRYNIKPPEICNDKAFVNDGKSKIDTMLDMIQKPVDTSYTVIQTSTSAPSSSSKGITPNGTEGGTAEVVAKKGTKKKESTHLSATDAANAMRGGVAHLLKNRFNSSSISTSIPPPPVPPKVVSKSANKAGSYSNTGNDFLGADMFSRLHTATPAATSEVVGTASTTIEDAVSTILPVAPALSLFKSIFGGGDNDDESDSEDSGDEGDDEKLDDVGEGVSEGVRENEKVEKVVLASAADIVVASDSNRVLGCSSGPVDNDATSSLSQLELIRQRYASSSNTVDLSNDINTATNIAKHLKDIIPISTTMFVARSDRVTTTNKNTSSGVTIGGSIGRRVRLAATGVHSRGTGDGTIRIDLVDEEKREGGEDNTMQSTNNVSSVEVGNAMTVESLPFTPYENNNKSNNAMHAVDSSDEEEDDDKRPNRRKRVVKQPIIVRQAPLEPRQIVPAAKLIRQTEIADTVAVEDSKESADNLSSLVVPPSQINELKATQTEVAMGQLQPVMTLVEMNRLRNEQAQTALLQSVQLQEDVTGGSIYVDNRKSTVSSSAGYRLQNINPHLVPTSFNSTLRLLSAQLDTEVGEKKSKKDKDKKRESKKSSKHHKHKKEKKSKDKAAKKSKSKKSAKDKIERNSDYSSNSSSSDSE